MDFGTRLIRTAGKGSGSVEVTLPAALRRLVGLPCRITLHDGAQPDIVLQPDLAGARAAFAVIWHGMAQALAADPAPDFASAGFHFGLLPQQAAPATPYLCWQDGLALASGGSPAAAAEVIAACGENLAPETGVAPALAAQFGAACGFVAVGEILHPGWQEPCDIAAMELSGHAAWLPGAAFAASPDIRAPAFWAVLAPGLSALAALFAALSQPGSAYPALHAAWRRGRSIELNRG
jgi:hypothetical protein